MGVTASGLTFRYGAGAPVLDGLDLTLAPGEIACLLGPNGTGKTTLLRCLAGALRAERGTVSMGGQRNLPARERARRLAYVPQAAGDSALPLLDMVLMGRTPYLAALAVPDRRDRMLAQEALERVGIGQLAQRAFNRVSGGERQLALIARALAQRPRVLLMDEPTASLDLGNQVRVLRIVRALAADGLAVLFTSHHPEHALLLGARVLTLAGGRVAVDGPAAQVLDASTLSGLYGATVEIITRDGAPIAFMPCL